MKYLFLLLAALLCFCSCTSNKYMLHQYPRLKVEGENGAVEFKQNRNANAELLYIRQDTLYLQVSGSKNLFYKTALSDVNKLTVDLYVNKDWVAPVLLLEILPATVFTIIGMVVTGVGGAVLLVSFIPGITTTALFISGTPEKPVYSTSQLMQSNDLTKYCRYPTELTPENFEKSFKHKLNEFKNLSELGN